MTTLTSGKNSVSTNLTLEAFGYTGMNKQELIAALLTSTGCKITFTTPLGEEINLESFFEPDINDIELTDENGIVIEDADQVTF